MKVFVALLALLCSTPAAAVSPYLVKDINPESLPGSSTPANFRTLGDVALFEASDGQHGRELWRSDGTAAGTYMLADACAGHCFEEIVFLAVTGTRAYYFEADAPGGLTHLWVTDGTRAGTLKLAAEPLAARVPFRGVAEAGGILYFATQTGLWRSDGTPAGTGPLADWPLAGDVNARELTAVGDIVFFSADDGGGRSLWKSDGTPAGTVEVADVEPRFPRALGGRLSFFVTDETGTALWRSDGTPAGTVAVLELPDAVTAAGTAPARIFDAAVHGGLLYFLADTGAKGQELWVSDGTESGTRVLTSFEVPTAFFGDEEVNPSQRFSLPRESQGGRFAFLVMGPQGVEVWVTDGTVSGSGTRPLRVVCPAPCEVIGYPTLLQPVPFQGQWLFTAFDEARGFEPWMTDGTAAGTRLVRDICAGACSSNTHVLGRLGNRLVVAAEDTLHGQQLWITDGTPRGTLRLSNLLGIFPFNLEGAVVNGSFLFPVYHDATGAELWITDGTRSGTGLLVDIDTRNTGGSFPQAWMPAGNEMYFFANDGRHGFELWKSDGTAAGTRLVADLTRGEASSPIPPGESAFARGKVFFNWSPVGASSLGFWRSDGTAAGTFRLTPDGVSVNPAIAPVVVGDRVYFVAGDAAHGEELWRTDGRVKGTRRVADLEPGAAGSSPRELTAFHGRLYFVADGRGLGAELWRTDGTARGTTLVKDVHPESHGNPRLLRVLGDRLYFFAEDGEHGTALWRSDGSTPGTALLIDVSPGEETVRPLWLVPAVNRLYYAVESEGVASAWITGGTLPVARRFATFPFLDATAVFVGGRVVFNAGSPEEGMSLWMSEGTEADLQQLLDFQGDPVRIAGTPVVFEKTLLFPGPDGRLWQWTGPQVSTRPFLQLADGTLGKNDRQVFVAAEDPEVGIELWAIWPD